LFSAVSGDLLDAINSGSFSRCYSLILQSLDDYNLKQVNKNLHECAIFDLVLSLLQHKTSDDCNKFLKTLGQAISDSEVDTGEWLCACAQANSFSMLYDSLRNLYGFKELNYNLACHDASNLISTPESLNANDRQNSNCDVALAGVENTIVES
jgi:hypothetical protein